MRVMDLEIVSDVIVAEDGFLGVRRVRVRNVREDGSRSAEYGYDFVSRPKGLDAVVVAAWYRDSKGDVKVLVRDQIRPAVFLGRPDPRLFLRECVAGIVEPGDIGEAGLRQRASIELEEEAGFRVAPEALVVLGAGMFPSPGAMSERLWFFAAEVDPGSGSTPQGDGSPAEEGAVITWMPLEQAIAACMAGQIIDLKTETALRRLKLTLGPQEGSNS